ncbi:MAG: hypothetical protein HN370_03355 [Phycisphaerales bacterium]|jgi:hypothetical protein|nr:hypothetical protein [Phycisphaerales bacterium]
MSNQNKSSPEKIISGVITVILVVGALWFFWGGGVEQQVASDMIKQYDIAKKNGTAIDAYVQASMVAAAFLQAEDETNYIKWKQIEKQEAKRAGMPAN